MTFTATAATGTYPLNSAFTSEVQDSSAVGYYVGPSFTIQVIDPTTIVSILVTPGGTNTATSYTAGTAVYTVKATVTAAEAQAGLAIVFTDTGTGAASATYPSSFGSSSVSTSAATSTTSTASTTFQPSEVAGLTGIPKVTIGTCAAAGCTATSASTITTVAGAPSSVTVTAAGSSTKTGYITTSGTPTWASPALSAEILAGGVTGALTDAFGNAVTSGITFAAGQGCTILSFGGLFDVASAKSTTDTLAGGGAGCTTAGAIVSGHNYFQGLTFGTTTYVQVSMTGTYNAATFTATGNSQTLSTSSMDTTAVVGTPGLSVSVAAGTISAGSAAGVATVLTLTYTLSVNQLGVPITFLGVNATDYGGSFVGGTGSACYGVCPGGAHISDSGNVTVNSVENTGGTAAIATAKYTIDTTLGASVTFKAQFANPITGTPSHIIGPSGPTGAYVTGAGAPAKLAIKSYFTSPLANPTSKSVAGGTIYLNIVLVDYWSNSVTCTAAICGAQLQINLAASPSSAGTFTATSVYIAQGSADTNTAPSFGLIKFVLSSSAALGAVTLSATGFYSGMSTLTVVSPNPTISVTSPSGTVGHTVYSKFSGVGFSGSAAASAGYVAGSVTISSVTYSVDGATAVTASGTTAWTAVPTMSNGLHTITFTVTDSNGNTATNSTKVLVDTSAPNITNPTVLAYGAGTAIVFTVVDSEGDLGTVSATVNGTALASSQVTITSGTNNPGSSVTYTVSVTGLAATTGHYGIALTATDSAGNSATGTTVVVTVTVQQAQSLVVQGTPTSGKIGNYEGVTVSYQNEWSSSQNVVVFAVWKNSLGQTVYISAGSATLANGKSQSFFLPEVGLASGTYTVNVFVWTTSNTSVSVTTTVTVTF